MKENHFVYVDLSTYDLRVAKKFYSTVFNWKYYNSGEDYWISFSGNKEASGLYETPKKFREMNMPSFWMSYIQVNSVVETVERAKKLGGIIELVDLDASIGKIALIRDPLGAGFTIYEGDSLNVRTKNTPNTCVWNELFVSDVSKIKAFYEAIFNWTIAPAGWDRYDIADSHGMVISSINEVDNSLKGKYEYWSVFFRVKNIEATKKRAIDCGGILVYEDSFSTVLADKFGAFFHIVDK